MSEAQQATRPRLWMALLFFIGFSVGAWSVTSAPLIDFSRFSDLFHPSESFLIYFREVEGLTIAAPVRMGGLRIGRVEAIQLSSPTESHGDPKRNIRVTVAIQKRYSAGVRSDSRARLLLEGLLGGRYIEVARGVSTSALAPGAEIAADEIPEVSLRALIEKIGNCVEQLGERWQKDIRSH